jgi:hypothetical protein
MFLDESQQSFSFISSYIDQATISNLFEYKAIIRTRGVTYVFYKKNEGPCLISSNRSSGPEGMMMIRKGLWICMRQRCS